jgi:surface antigen
MNYFKTAIVITIRVVRFGYKAIVAHQLAALAIVAPMLGYAAGMQYGPANSEPVSAASDDGVKVVVVGADAPLPSPTPAVTPVPTPAPTPAATPVPAPVAAPVTRAAVPPVQLATVHYGNSYSYGYCTYYVATRRNVPPFWGNANAWYSHAVAAGWAVGSVPRVGAIAWTGAGTAGHVAYVERVSGASVYVSEMNFNGNWGRVTYRWASASSFRYIY